MPDYEPIVAKLTSKLSEWTRGASDRITPATYVLMRTEEGQLTHKAFQQGYYPILHQGIEAGAKQASDGIKAGIVTQKVDIGGIVSGAQKSARLKIGGPKDANFVTLAKSIQKRHGQLAAESYANAVAYLLKDYHDPLKHLDVAAKPEDLVMAKRLGGMAPYSPLKKQMVLNGVGLKSTKPTFNPAGPVESAISGVLHATFAPAVAIPHIGTVFNTLFGTTPDKFLKGAAEALHGSLRENIDKSEAMMVTGAFAETHLNNIREWNMFKATNAPKFTQNSAAYYTYKILHQPGFRPLRDYTLLGGVNIAQTTVKDIAEKFAKNPQDKTLLFHLSQYGLNPKDILNAHGQLNQQMMERAVYSFVDKHYFIDNAMSRSSFFQGTATGRILGMYHGYITRQAKLMARSLSDGFKGQGAIHTGRNLAIMATLFPVVGEVIKLTQQGVRGQNAVGTAEDDFANVTGENGIYAGAGTYFEALGHMGAFGVYNHLLRGGYTHSLINEAAGPVINSVTNLAQDSKNAATHIINQDQDSTQESLAPVERDIMYDIPGLSSLAYVLGHRVLPKANENPEDAPERKLWDWFQEAPEDKKQDDQNKEQEN